MSHLNLRKELKKLANPQKAKILQRFFKTGKGEYGEGDVFLGITVPASRKIAIKFKNLSFSEIADLLESRIHEERLIALLILVQNFNLGGKKTQEKVYEFYLKKTKYINNWDLVDLSADKIVGRYLLELDSRHSGEQKRDQNLNKSGFWTSQSDILIKLAKSKSIWERRIAVLSTFQFIKNNRFEETLKIAQILLQDQHDLIQKAVGWMLREVGKRDLKIEIEFLNKHYRKMPRTKLRYAIEKFPENLRLVYLKNKAQQNLSLVN